MPNAGQKKKNVLSIIIPKRENESKDNKSKKVHLKASTFYQAEWAI
jgi:hypothetical protein